MNSINLRKTFCEVLNSIYKFNTEQYKIIYYIYVLLFMKYIIK